MRKILFGLLSVTAIAVATPAVAQSIYFGAPGVEVGVGAPVYRDRDSYRTYEVDRPRYRSQRSYDGAYARGDCRTITIQRDDGSVRKIRRCG